MNPQIWCHLKNNKLWVSSCSSSTSNKVHPSEILSIIELVLYIHRQGGMRLKTFLKNVIYTAKTMM